MTRPVVRLASFLVGLIAVFGAALAVGRAVGPIDQAPHLPSHPMPASDLTGRGAAGGVEHGR